MFDYLENIINTFSKIIGTSVKYKVSTSFEEKDRPYFPNQKVSTGIPLKTQPVTTTKSYSADFHCSWGLIPITFKCDGIDNCGDNSDEKNCENFEKTSTVVQLNTLLELSTAPISTKEFMLVYH